MVNHDSESFNGFERLRSICLDFISLSISLEDGSYMHTYFEAPAYYGDFLCSFQMNISYEHFIRILQQSDEKNPSLQEAFPRRFREHLNDYGCDIENNRTSAIDLGIAGREVSTSGLCSDTTVARQLLRSVNRSLVFNS